MAIKLRERFLTDRGVGALGTTRNPLPLEGKVGTTEPTVQTVSLRLGFEAIPSTQVFSFLVSRPAQIRALRRSTDPYIVHVAVGLQGPDDNRGPGCRPLVQTANGDSGWHTIEAGRWWLVVACGMPIDISLELDIQLLAVPAALTLAPYKPQEFRLLSKPAAARVLAAAEPEPPLLPSRGGRAWESWIPAAPPLVPWRPEAASLPLSQGPDSAAMSVPCDAVPAAELQAAGLLPEGFDLWGLRPWRGGVVAGFPWLKDRRGHLHVFSPWPLLIVPLPGPLEPEDVVITVDGLGPLKLRPDALRKGIGQGRYPANTPEPGSVRFVAVLQGRACLSGTWHSGGGAEHQVP